MFGSAPGRVGEDVLVIESNGFPPSKWGFAIAVEPNGNGGDIPSRLITRQLMKLSVMFVQPHGFSETRRSKNNLLRINSGFVLRHNEQH